MVRMIKQRKVIYKSYVNNILAFKKMIQIILFDKIRLMCFNKIKQVYKKAKKNV